MKRTVFLVMNFLDFPKELLLKICSYLPITAVLTHKIVSKGLKGIMEEFIKSLFSDEKNRLLMGRDNKFKSTLKYQCSLEKVRKRAYLGFAEGRERESAYLSWHKASPLTEYGKEYYRLSSGDCYAYYSIEEIEDKVRDVMECLGWPARNWDVSRSNDLSFLFVNCESFNEDISSWDVSNVKSMAYMFILCRSFNQNLSAWNTAKLESTEGMFLGAEIFDGEMFLNVNEVTNFNHTFSNCFVFNSDISRWNTSKATSMDSMFASAAHFNSDIGGWDTKNVTSMIGMFKGSIMFNQDISGWNVNKVSDMSHMFENTSVYHGEGEIHRSAFNCDLYKWGYCPNLLYTRCMFKNATAFNGRFVDPDGDTKFQFDEVKECQSMFEGCAQFNQPLGSNFGKVENMSRMFYGAEAFNQDMVIKSSRCEDFSKMFYNAKNFNGEFDILENTFLGESADMSYMFFNARSFNRNISDWKVDTDNMMKNMFCNAISFNQDMSGWKIYDLLAHRNGIIRYIDGIFLNCKNLDFCMGNWECKFDTEHPDFDIHAYFGGADKMLKRFHYRNSDTCCGTRRCEGFEPRLRLRARLPPEE